MSEELMQDTKQMLEKFYKEELSFEEKRKLRNMLGILKDDVTLSIKKLTYKA